MRSYWSRWIQCDWMDMWRETCKEKAMWPQAEAGMVQLQAKECWQDRKPGERHGTAYPGPSRSMAYQHLDFRLLASRTKSEWICWCQLPSLWRFVGAALEEQYRGSAMLSVPHVPCSPSACRPSPAFSLCAFLAMSSPSKIMCRRN